MENFRLRATVAIAGLVMGLVWVAPNFLNLADSWWPSKRKLNYGLDIQGGLHLVMGVDVESVIRESTNRLIGQLRAELKEQNVVFADINSAKPELGEIRVSVGEATQLQAVNDFFNERYATVLQTLDADATSVTYRYFETYLRDHQTRVIQQSVETIRNRIDEFGVAEPSIAAQGTDRIIIQLPGVTDAEQAKALINNAAKLEFAIVSDQKSPAELEQLIADAEKKGEYSLKTLRYTQYVNKINEDLKASLPPKTMIIFEKAESAASMEIGKIPYLVSTDTGLGGEDLDDAFVSFNEYGVPEVSLVFNAAGANKFSDITGNNTKKLMAIVLDKVVKSAPVINQRIAGGRAVITLGGGRDRQKSLDEAKMIATSLRAGALPATLEQLEERRVGPSLGADSIKKAELAGLIGALLVFAFMLLRYKTSGVIANITLVINVLLVLAILTSLGATLTLPGIAGIALTIGFAVDANVLVLERMREEFRAGSSFKVAVTEGYGKAMSAILDSNITTAATAVILLYFGTGPVKGFAVTLLIGIGTTLFANVFLSKLIYDFLVGKMKMKQIAM